MDKLTRSICKELGKYIAENENKKINVRRLWEAVVSGYRPTEATFSEFSMAMAELVAFGFLESTDTPLHWKISTSGKMFILTARGIQESLENE